MHFVAQNIKYFRKKFSLSQCDLADRVGLNRGNIASYEKNIAEPKICNLIKLAQFFQIGVSEIVLHDYSNGSEEIMKEEVNVEPIFVDKDFQEVLEKSREYEDIINGMKCYHKFQMERLTGTPEDIALLSSEVNRLLSVSNCLMHSHKYLIQKIDNHDNCKDSND
ncbi:MAG: transcriptional regulator with XRE-family HTH domain [Cognaticolwellia sp.]|jgi:transcriptional regulator with XRE-family HTH domain|tara:strand:+ start:1906 stop:2400 length:495 start_codon:yes stop_codon:yes gene_type:complete